MASERINSMPAVTQLGRGVPRSPALAFSLFAIAVLTS